MRGHNEPGHCAKSETLQLKGIGGMILCDFDMITSWEYEKHVRV